MATIIISVFSIFLFDSTVTWVGSDAKNFKICSQVFDTSEEESTHTWVYPTETSLLVLVKSNNILTEIKKFSERNHQLCILPITFSLDSNCPYLWFLHTIIDIL